MRTTITIDDDIFKIVRGIAHARCIPIGRALSDLARKGLQCQRTPYSADEPGQLPRFQVRENAPPITPEQVKSAEDEL